MLDSICAASCDIVRTRPLRPGTKPRTLPCNQSVKVQALRVGHGSIVPRPPPVGERAQQVGPGPQGAERFQRLAVQQAYPLLGGLDADDSRVSRLGTLAVG